MTTKKKYTKYPDLRGPLRRRWRWKTLQKEYGRACYNTDCNGETIASWWEWENDIK